jgi:anaerobic selenocysteine-containing dehydrogenase
VNAVLDHPATGHATVAGLRAGGGGRRWRSRRWPIRSGASTRLRGGSSSAAEGPRHGPAGAARGPGAPRRGLVFAHGRTFAHFHSFYDHGRALPDLAAREDAPDLWIAPADAAPRGISDGDPVEIASPRGRFAARAKVTPRMQAGAVWMRDGWPGLNALTASAAVLPDAALDAFAFSVGQSDFGAVVEVRPRAATRS